MSAGSRGLRFWRPAGDGVRHAFRARRYEGQAEDVSVCGVTCALSQELSETDWCTAPTCPSCNGILRAEQDERTAARDANTDQR
ncbi:MULTISPECIES: zinc finger protein [unclassified Saccharopolyspora]|uniref:zinc finger protein n=1 Tax=unclassified Saccharopolyspora TaxID=2646250 RepID=UPI001CD28766|nr:MULTISPECIES: zinc finger protein [unclassified Saccharopolyspora]MCA1185108.1 hypothetical protein [Saccharopolyspora sp. 6T]MCA1191416.1 hypothetical protein [Saccharopolyspora sp. 6V]MCA1224983.1 hypothetical protein [Saccharopolyspora sp. 6M]MCA1278526.1 hypothetical protein [Saccharopolyspora sp. 7B]